MQHVKTLRDVQLSVTSPPYANFIGRSVADRKKTHKSSKLVADNNSRVRVYSAHPDDLGNLDYDAFLAACETLLGDLFTATKPGGYTVWVVKDQSPSARAAVYLDAFRTSRAAVRTPAGGGTISSPGIRTNSVRSCSSAIRRAFTRIRTAASSWCCANPNEHSRDPPLSVQVSRVGDRTVPRLRRRSDPRSVLRQRHDALPKPRAAAGHT